MLAEFTTLTIFHFLLVFARLGSAVMLLPGFGEVYVSPRVRLSMALAITLVLLSFLADKLPPLPANFPEFAVLLIGEIVAGLFIGAIARIIQSIMHIAGMMIAFQSSLASAVLFDPSQGSQGSVFGSFMTIMAITLLFVSNLHHLLLMAIVDSYTVFEVGKFPPVADFAEIAPRLLSDAFLVSFKIASPLVVIGLLLYLGTGMMSRLMPNMQVFFIMIPLQLMVSFYILMITLSAGMMWYLEHYKDIMISLFDM